MPTTNKTVAVIGLGYVGLPLAVLASSKGWHVLGVDIDQDKVKRINHQQSPFKDDTLTKDLAKHPITASTDFSAVNQASIIVVAVPTPVNKDNQPDLTPLTSAVNQIKPHLQAEQTVIIESTVNPGVMDEVISPILIDTPDIHLAHCPERINPGDPKWSVRNIPRVLGSYTEEGAKQALSFYSSVLEAPIKVMQTPTEAEAVKILENTFRDINIAYINEMARSFDALGIDITNVIEGAATKPFSFMAHYPGSGVGGHCISVDPYYMIERGKQAGFDHQFLKLARHINESMPAYTVDLLTQAAKETKLPLKKLQVALLGLSYKKDVDDLRNSPALKILNILNEKDIKVTVFDPYVPAKSTVSNVNEALDDTNAVILACDHTELVRQLTPATLKQNKIKIVIDGKNALDMPDITEQGITYHGIGRSPQSQ